MDEKQAPWVPQCVATHIVLLVPLNNVFVIWSWKKPLHLTFRVREGRRKGRTPLRLAFRVREGCGGDTGAPPSHISSEGGVEERKNTPLTRVPSEGGVVVALKWAEGVLYKKNC